jgi:hypothetical protein
LALEADEAKKFDETIQEMETAGRAGRADIVT